MLSKILGLFEMKVRYTKNKIWFILMQNLMHGVGIDNVKKIYDLKCVD